MGFVQTTIDSQFLSLVEAKGSEKALFYKEQSYSWEEINQIAEKMAADMIKLNVEKGSHIAIWCANSPLYLCAFFAIEKIGCISVPINPAYKTWEMNQLVSYGDFKGIFCDESTVRKLQKTEGIDFVSYIGSDVLGDILAKEEPAASIKEKIRERQLQADAHDDACMLFTSGTTGGAKGVVLTHFQLLNVAWRAVQAMHWRKEDIFCLSLPLFHSFGLSTGVLAALFHQGTVCMNDSFKSTAVMACVDRHHCTVLNGVPTMFLSVLYNPNRWRYDLSSLNSGIIAGSGVHAKDFMKISRELNIPHLMQSYGQTEASPSITFSPYEDALEKRANSVGRAIPDVRIRIWNTLTDAEAAAGEGGEVEIMGFNTMRGYFKRNDESEKVLRKDGWMRTGDMGYLDKEGYLHILGRMKEMIIRGGENIAPQEIEEVLLNMQDVRQVKVFGIKEAVIQENIAACIETDANYQEREVRSYVNRYLADYKVPKYVFLFKKFPENASGKVDAKQLRDIVEKRRCERA